MEDLKQTRKKVYIRSAIFFAFLLGSLLTPSLLTLQYKRRAHLSALQDGLTTCFTRIQNSYTATFLRQFSSDYLTSGFFKLTEDCFAQSKVLMEKSIGGKISGKQVSLNQWLNDVHLFHQNLSSRSKLRDQQHLRVVDKRFSVIEGRLEDIFELTNQEIQSSKDWPLALALIWLAMVAGLVAVVMQSWKMLKARMESAHRAEFEAHAGRHEGDFLEGGQAKQIILEGLKAAGLVECARLFENFYPGEMSTSGASVTQPAQIEASSTADEVDIKEVVYSPKLMTDEKFDEKALAKIDKAWSEDQVVQKIDNRVEIVQLIENVVDKLATDLLLKQIKVKFDTAKDVKTEIEKDELEHILFQVSVLGLKACTEEKSKMSFIASEKDESLAIVLRIDYAKRLDPSEIEFEILNQLVEKLNGSYKCSFSLEEEVCEFQLSFSSGEEKKQDTKKKRLISLKRGRKKDLEKELRA